MTRKLKLSKATRRYLAKHRRLDIEQMIEIVDEMVNGDWGSDERVVEALRKASNRQYLRSYLN